MPDLSSELRPGSSEGHSLASEIYDLYCARVRADKLIHPFYKNKRLVRESNTTKIARMGG